MFAKISRLFVIKTKWEAYLIIYALALGATERGSNYLLQYPGFGGKAAVPRLHRRGVSGRCEDSRLPEAGA